MAKKIKSFKDLHLDDRLIKAVAKVKWPKPTLVQAATLPLSIEGRDIICKSKRVFSVFDRKRTCIKNPISAKINFKEYQKLTFGSFSLATQEDAFGLIAVVEIVFVGATFPIGGFASHFVQFYLVI